MTTSAIRGMLDEWSWNETFWAFEKAGCGDDFVALLTTAEDDYDDGDTTSFLIFCDWVEDKGLAQSLVRRTRLFLEAAR